MESKKIYVDTLLLDGKKLNDSITSAKHELRVLEGDLQGLQKKHDYTLQDSSNVIKRLENDNWSLNKLTEELEGQVHNSTNDARNINFDMKHQREDALKREADLSNANSRIESESVKEKEL